jgi:hypothetical protein
MTVATAKRVARQREATDVALSHRPPRPETGRSPRPDSRPSRLAVGVTGLAALSAMVTAVIAPSNAPVSVAAADASTGLGTSGVSGAAGGDALTGSAQPTPQVIHVKRVVQLKPGQTAPPGASVKVVAAPTPRVVVIQAPAPPAPRVVVTTRQSGRP